MNEHYKEFNNCWFVNHPTINFFTFSVEVVTVFGHKCILEKYQDGEIWSDDEYWGSVLYDFDNDRYTSFSTYVNEDEIERILKIWMNNKDNPDDIWDGRISEDFVNDEILATDKTELAVNFYKSYLQFGEKIELENFYKNYYNRHDKKNNDR